MKLEEIEVVKDDEMLVEFTMCEFFDWDNEVTKRISEYDEYIRLYFPLI